MQNLVISLEWRFAAGVPILSFLKNPAVGTWISGESIEQATGGQPFLERDLRYLCSK